MRVNKVAKRGNLGRTQGKSAASESHDKADFEVIPSNGDHDMENDNV